MHDPRERSHADSEQERARRRRVLERRVWPAAGIVAPWFAMLFAYLGPFLLRPLFAPLGASGSIAVAMLLCTATPILALWIGSRALKPSPVPLSLGEKILAAACITSGAAAMLACLTVLIPKD